MRCRVFALPVSWVPVCFRRKLKRAARMPTPFLLLPFAERLLRGSPFPFARLEVFRARSKALPSRYNGDRPPTARLLALRFIMRFDKSLNPCHASFASTFNIGG